MSASPEPSEDWPVRYLDGVRAAPHEARARIAGGRLELSGTDTGTVYWPLIEVRVLETPDGALPGVLAPDPDTSARILFADPSLVAALEAATPRRGWLGRIDWPVARQVALWTGGAVASILFVLFVAIPLAAERLVALIPADFERRFGAEVVDALAGSIARDRKKPFCAGNSPPPLLAEIARRLEDRADLGGRLTIRIVDSPVINAFTGPGGQIVILRGLLELAQSPEELIGVLAHEVAHAERRDPMRGMIRSVATGAIVGLVFGDPIFFSSAAAFATLYIGISYSREVETATDARAFELLAGLGVPSAPLGAILVRMEKAAGIPTSGLLAHLSTHPPTAERMAAAAAAPASTRPKWEIDGPDWRALKAACP